MRELIAHLTGDYVVQTSHMATTKTQRWLPAIAHAASYTACFLPLTRDPRRLAVIGLTHLLIDHYRLARPMVWAKNHLAPREYWPAPDDLLITGSPGDTPDYLAVWLMIIADNTVHLAINHAALNVGASR